jgi:hypothetical protein
MDSTRGIYGNTRIFGDVNIKQNLFVEGDATFKNNLTAEKGIMFDAMNGIKYAAANNGAPGIYKFGSINNPGPPVGTQAVNCAAQPFAPVAVSQIPGWLQVYEDQGNGYVQGGGLMNFQCWNGTSSIDASTGGTTGGVLLINYFCGNNTNINTGLLGGWVNLGANVNMQKHVEIGDVQWGTGSDPNNIALEIRENNGKALVFKTYNNALPAISIDNQNLIGSPFTLYSDGRVRIGQKQTHNVHNDAMLMVDGKILSKSVYVTIKHWPDYVFNSDYVLPSLKDVEQYYLKYKHLPNIPSETEIMEKGFDLGEMNKILLQKIEELTIYVVELEKKTQNFNDLEVKIEELSKTIKLLQDKINFLSK